MKKNKFIMAVLTGSAAVVCAMKVMAQADPGADGPPGADHAGGPPDGGMRHHPPLPAIVLALDANHDGIIDSNEIANASKVLLSLDKRGDGRLTPDEYMGRPPKPFGPGPDGAPGDAPQGPPPNVDNAQQGDSAADGPPPGPRHHHPPMPAIVRALDANHDGIIDSNEIANASAALLTLDINHDGQLTRNEYMGRPPRRMPDGQNGPGPGPFGGPSGNAQDDSMGGPPPDQ